MSEAQCPRCVAQLAVWHALSQYQTLLQREQRRQCAKHLPHDAHTRTLLALRATISSTGCPMPAASSGVRRPALISSALENPWSVAGSFTVVPEAVPSRSDVSFPGVVSVRAMIWATSAGRNTDDSASKENPCIIFRRETATVSSLAC